jgi:hypothetical protein
MFFVSLNERLPTANHDSFKPATSSLTIVLGVTLKKILFIGFSSDNHFRISEISIERVFGWLGSNERRPVELTTPKKIKSLLLHTVAIENSLEIFKFCNILG